MSWSRLLAIGRPLAILAAALGLAIFGYVSVGLVGSSRSNAALLISLALLLWALVRAYRSPEQAATAGRIGTRVLTLLPGGVLVYLSYNAGGFFPGPTARVAVLLGLILAARLAMGAGGGRALSAMAVGVALYTAWVLVSGIWSKAPERALTQADLALVYGLVLILFGTTVTGSSGIRWVMRGLALGSFAVCLGGFLSRAFPRLWPIPASLDTSRLSFPLTYWNALGALAALGIVLCVGLTSDAREPRVVKSLAASAVPLMSVTLLLTFSRGAIGAGIIGLIAFALLDRSRSLLLAALAVAPPTAVALVVGYQATALAQALNGSALQTSQGHHLTLVVAGASVAALLARWIFAALDPRLLELALRRPKLSAAATTLRWAALIAVVLVSSLAVGLPGALKRQYEGFVHNSLAGPLTTARSRLTAPSANGRLELWRVAVHEFDGAPVLGTGAGTFATVWATQRPSLSPSAETHSVYLENLGELGFVGLALFLCVLLGSLFAIQRRIRGPDRTLYAAAFAVALVWAVHAGVDWDWEMPAVTLPVFVLAGAALGRSDPGGNRRRPLLSCLVLIVVIAPALVSVSQAHLDASRGAFQQGDCTPATGEAQAALSPLRFRQSAHEVLAYCDVVRGHPANGLTEMAAAVRDDPNNWEPHYGLAVVLAAVGRDPRAATRAALALDPREPVINALATKFRDDPRSRWPTDAASVSLPISGQYGPSLLGLRKGQATATPGR